MGFQPTEVWQFWHGMLRLPCGLRETLCPFAWLYPEIAMPQTIHNRAHAVTHTRALREVRPKFPTTLSQSEKHLRCHESSGILGLFA